jgi:hypothetical protein
MRQVKPNSSISIYYHRDRKQYVVQIVIIKMYSCNVKKNKFLAIFMVHLPLKRTFSRNEAIEVHTALALGGDPGEVIAPSGVGSQAQRSGRVVLTANKSSHGAWGRNNS